MQMRKYYLTSCNFVYAKEFMENINKMLNLKIQTNNKIGNNISYKMIKYYLARNILFYFSCNSL
jgi:hypothetical protein